MDNIGVQEPPNDPMIYNRRQADGNFRSLTGFFFPEDTKESNVKTGDVLRAMLTENTGIQFMDSGGAYGRAWQQNKGRDFDTEPAATLTVEEGFIDIRRSTYHFLNECLEFDEAMDERFQAFNRAQDPGDQIPWLALMEEFTDSLDATGVYGEGSPLTINTYNHDSLLDQVIQYTYFELDEQGYVLLQIHGGCDVRGGYTAPKAFRCNIESSPSIFSDGEAQITCKGEESHRWYVQEGSWETDHYKSADARFLTEFPIIADEFPIIGDTPKGEESITIWRNAKGIECPEPRYHRVRREGKIAEGVAFGVIWQDSTGVHCPLCGEVLEVW